MNSITQLGLGTAALGRPQYINVRQEKAQTLDLDAFRQNGFNILEKAYEFGIRYFDTAPGYGLAEQLLLEWLATKNDQTIEVATKWGYTYVANFNPDAKVHEVKEHSLSKLNEQWQDSNVFLPYLKVYQIHSATLETGVLENQVVLERLHFLKEEHNIKIGLTTTGANQVEVIKKALDVSVEGNALFDAFQVTYNILDQSFAGISDNLRNNGKLIIIKEALANGRLFRNKAYPKYNDMYNATENLAKKYEVGVDAIALNFCLNRVSKGTVLSGAGNINQLQENLKSNSFNLTENEILQLTSLRVDESKYWKERKELAWN